MSRKNKRCKQPAVRAPKVLRRPFSMQRVHGASGLIGSRRFFHNRPLRPHEGSKSMSEIWIYDDIGPDYWGLISAKSVIRDLEAIGKGKPVTVRINSPGGDIVEAQAI